MSYLNNIFLQHVDKTKVKTIFELGSRDLVDAQKLQAYYDAKVYAFECNSDCLQVCRDNYRHMNQDKIILVDKAVAEQNGPVKFYPFDLSKYNNMGASSMLKIDFSNHHQSDSDYGRPNPQKEVVVEGTRLDSFMQQQQLDQIDLLCIDLQGYELNALKSLGDKLSTVTYIITECSVKSVYNGGANFIELDNFLNSKGFSYVCSNRFGYNYPNLQLTGFSEFDALFIRK